MIPNLVRYNLPVYTVVGRYLGRVVQIEVDKIGQQVLYYHVAPWFVFARLWHKRLLISPSQVVKITKVCMVVEEIKSQPAVDARPGLAPGPSA